MNREAEIERQVIRFLKRVDEGRSASVESMRKALELPKGEYVPMSNYEHYVLWAESSTGYMPEDEWRQDFMWEAERAIEAEVIKRMQEQGLI